MDRRNFLRSGTALIALAFGSGWNGFAWAQRAAAIAAEAIPFDHAWLVGEARRLAENPYEAPSTELSGSLDEIGYDQYRDIRYRPEARIWANEPTSFNLDLFHRGFLFREPVTLSIVDDGAARQIPFSPELFDYGPNLQPPAGGDDLDFAGFRVRHPINTPGLWDEFLVFQGASYFRAVARDQVYGLSARGLAIDTAEPEGEEFPAFRKFWIEHPSFGASQLVVHALLDSPSTTGAYRFTAVPGAETVIVVEASSFPRQEIRKIGIAPLTSMFLLDSTNPGAFDDFRPAVHDSNGLQMLTGDGEWVWRPLANPRELQISMFRDHTPRGFGLMQRARSIEDFEDLEAQYERRPSLWIEPIGDWGDGFVELVEIPTGSEINDNIVAYWRPDGAVPAGGPWRFSYRMRWTDRVEPPTGMLVTKASRMGLTLDGQRRLFVVDFVAGDMTTEGLTLEVEASAGEIASAVIHRRQSEDAIRASFELEIDDDAISELRLRLLADGQAVSETWLYRWTGR